MPARDEYDAVIIGSGPNGLGAAVTLARRGFSVLVLEAADTIGGGSRTAELTLPGFRSDVCSAVHPLGASSPLFRSLPLHEHGLEWVHPEICLAHPFDGGTAAELRHSFEDTVRGLGRDGIAYERLMGPFVRDWNKLVRGVLYPMMRVPPPHPFLMARFGLLSLFSAAGLSRTVFRTQEARALFAGMAAHAILPLDRPLTASFGLLLGAAAHGAGWPVAKGGSQAIADALASYLRSLGGEVVTNTRVRSLDELPRSRVVLCDIAPKQLLAIAGDRFPERYVRKLEKYRYGLGVFKVDWALSGPIPWQADACRRAGTVHVGGTLPEIEAAERAASHGRIPERPYVLVSQQSLFDPTRVPGDGRQVAWAYCHVPPGTTHDMTAAIEAQIERFAPGFRERILARQTMSPVDLEAYNPNYVAGDIASGSHAGTQLFFRPTFSLDPYRTPLKGLYLCSASTPPGAGVHGMCGYWAARSALRHELRDGPRTVPAEAAAVTGP